MLVRPRQCSMFSSTVTIVIVYPSGRAIAPRVCPVTPEPPVALTTLTGTPISCSSSTATWRETRSVPPPAAHGQISTIGRLG